MTFLIQTEITAVLDGHRLTSSRGWRNENGTTTYTCSCGHDIVADANPRRFVAPTTLLAEHQAEVIERMGFTRTADQFDGVAIESMVRLLHERKHRIDEDLEAAHRGHAIEDAQRLRGALSELSTLLAAVDEIVGVRTVDGRVELPIDNDVLITV